MFEAKKAKNAFQKMASKGLVTETRRDLVQEYRKLDKRFRKRQISQQTWDALIMQKVNNAIRLGVPAFAAAAFLAIDNGMTWQRQATLMSQVFENRSRMEHQAAIQWAQAPEAEFVILSQNSKRLGDEDFALS